MPAPALPAAADGTAASGTHLPGRAACDDPSPPPPSPPPDESTAIAGRQQDGCGDQSGPGLHDGTAGDHRVTTCRFHDKRLRSSNCVCVGREREWAAIDVRLAMGGPPSLSRVSPRPDRLCKTRLGPGRRRRAVSQFSSSGVVRTATHAVDRATTPGRSPRGRWLPPRPATSRR